MTYDAMREMTAGLVQCGRNAGSRASGNVQPTYKNREIFFAQTGEAG